MKNLHFMVKNIFYVNTIPLIFYNYFPSYLKL